MRNTVVSTIESSEKDWSSIIYTWDLYCLGRGEGVQSIRLELKQM